MDLPDDEKRGLDEWMMQETWRLHFGYGHSLGTALLMARYSRDMIQAGLERPQPLFVVTGL